MNIRAYITVKGHVQGVGYRYFTLNEARQLKLTGFVKNLQNGDVKVIVEGDKSTIESLVKTLRTGPRLSNVTDLYYDFEEYRGEFDNFAIR